MYIFLFRGTYLQYHYGYYSCSYGKIFLSLNKNKILKKSQQLVIDYKPILRSFQLIKKYNF